MDMEKTRKAIQAGIFERPFGHCELRQCDSAEPIIYTGSGLLSQDANKRLVVRVFAAPVDLAVAMDREFNRPFTPGKLTADNRYYELTAVDLNGGTWTAERVWVSGNFGGTGTYLLVEPNQLNHNTDTKVVNGSPKIRTFIPADIKLPWHVLTNKGAMGASVDRFEHDMGEYWWAARKEMDGVRLEIVARDRPVWPAFVAFWRALAILVGRPIPVSVFQIAERNEWTDRLVNDYVADIDADILPPFPVNRDHADDAHAFIAAYMRHALIGKNGHDNHDDLIFEAWDRVVRANESDIQNSALVLSVAIENIIKHAMTNDADRDAAFVAEVDAAKNELEPVKDKIGERAWNALMSSLGNAIRPRPKDVLNRLVDQGAVTPELVKAWSGLRNTAAHGGELHDTREDLQEHFDAFHTCLNLFYKLVFLVIGYRGVMQDFSTENWPVVPFPSVPPADVAPDDPATAASVVVD